MANAAARLMGSFQDAILTLDRIRRGGRQTVKVVQQHVEVDRADKLSSLAGASKTGAESAVEGPEMTSTSHGRLSWPRLAEEWQPARQP